MAKAGNKPENLKPYVRLSIGTADGEGGSMFGKGIADLCLGVRKLGSLNAAAKSMHMAYSKAWRIMKETEAAFGIQLLIRDGAHGSTLTDAGNQLLDTYLKVNEAASTYAEKLYAEVIHA